MEFFEFVLVLSIVVVLPLGIVKSVIGYKERKMEFEREEGAGVTAGQLRTLLEDAVREANAPLLGRIDTLERRLSREGHFGLDRAARTEHVSGERREREEHFEREDRLAPGPLRQHDLLADVDAYEPDAEEREPGAAVTETRSERPRDRARG